jgi:hypothetical protein
MKWGMQRGHANRIRNCVVESDLSFIHILISTIDKISLYLLERSRTGKRPDMDSGNSECNYGCSISLFLSPSLFNETTTEGIWGTETKAGV